MHLEEVGNIIIKNIKAKGDKVTIEYLDSNRNEEKIKLNLDIYSLYKLDKNMEIDEDKWKEILDNNIKEDIKTYIIKLYNSKTISIYELRNKVNKKFKGNEALINTLIEDLINDGVLDDSKFVKEYYSYLNKELYGKYYILNFFKINEISKDLLYPLDFASDKELEKALKYVNKLIRKNKSNFMRLKVKIYSRLLSRGFDQEITMKVLNELNINEEDEKKSLKKDMDKIVSRELKKKGEIDYKVLNKKLISKGYKFSDINEAIQMLKGERDD